MVAVTGSPKRGSPKRPVILLSIEEDGTRASVRDELERRYSADYRITESDTAARASEALREAANRGDQVALLLADDPRFLPGGETVFAEARRLFPDIRRGLLINWGAWVDRETAESVLQLMATGQIDYYVIRPWQSPGILPPHRHRVPPGVGAGDRLAAPRGHRDWRRRATASP